MCDNTNGHGGNDAAGSAARNAGKGSAYGGIFGKATDRTTPPGRNGNRMVALAVRVLPNRVTVALARRAVRRRLAAGA